MELKKRLGALLIVDAVALPLNGCKAMNIFLIIPCVLALIPSLLYAAQVFKTRQISMLLLCVAALGLMFTELVFHLGNFSAADKLVYYLLVFYYLCGITGCLAHLAVSLQTSGWLNKRSIAVLLSIAAVNYVLLIIPGAALSGVQSIGYAFTRIAGPFYWVIQLTVVAAIAASIGILIHVAVKSENWQARRKALVLLIASTLFAVAIIGVVLLMQLGFKVSGLVVVPVTVGIFMLVQLYAEYEQRIFNLLSFVPASSEQVLTRNTICALLKYKSGDLQSAVNEFERGIIIDTLEKCQGNKSLAAEKLGISRTTLRRKLEDANANASYDTTNFQTTAKAGAKVSIDSGATNDEFGSHSPN